MMLARIRTILSLTIFSLGMSMSPCVATEVTPLDLAAFRAGAGPGSPNPGLRHYYPVLPLAAPARHRVDICIYGGTPAGVAAAVQARRMGKSVALAVFRRHVGGLTSSGLTNTDLGDESSIGGISIEFFRRVGEWEHFRSSQAETTFRAMLDEAGVPVLYEHRLAKAVKQDGKLTAIEFENGRRIEAAMFIDASYEGDLLAAAGVSYHVGRESNATYGEKHNGYFIADKHQFRFAVDPYRVPGDPGSGLLPGIAPGPPAAAGSGDERVQAYNFRLWAVEEPDALPWPKPAAYERDRYALHLRYLTSAPPGFEWDWRYQHGPVKLNHGDCNNAGPASTDYIGGSKDWPRGDYATRERIFQDHVTYQQGLMWFLANDPATPAEIRAYVSRFGLPRDEFVETGGWPHDLYIREGRRMVSRLVMTEHHALGTKVAEQSIGLASYQMDSHHTSRVIIDGVVKAEGNVEVPVPKPYPIGYQAIVPKEDECTNLLVAAAVSSSHIAFGSIRMEPVFMILGQSAATAASLAIDAAVPVQRLDYAPLREQLLRDGQKL